MVACTPPQTALKAGELPPEVLEEVIELLVAGKSYEDIRDFLAGRGHDIRQTAIGRYGRDFLETYGRMKLIEAKSKALTSGEEDGLILEEAASRLLAQAIVETLLAGEIDLKRLSKMLSDFARLQSSNVQREKLRREWKMKTARAAQDAEEEARGGGLSDEVAAEIRRKILGMAE